jgi:hypothetical protein
VSGELLAELVQFVEFSGMVGDPNDSFGEVEALSDELVELVGGKGLRDGYFLVLTHEFQLDLVHSQLVQLSIIIQHHPKIPLQRTAIIDQLFKSEPSDLEHTSFFLGR